MHFDTEKYTVYTWKSGVILHWILNPGLAFNELILGQRAPKVSLIDKTSDKPYMDRGYTPCPHCGHLHTSLIWSTQNNLAFGNWFGLYCHECGGIIPCLRNATSFILLALTAPLWWWFRDALKAAWLMRQPARYAKLDLSNLTFAKTSWLAAGTGFGGLMFLFYILFDPWYYGGVLTTQKFLGALFSSALAGLLFGLMMKFFLGKSGKDPKVSG